MAQAATLPAVDPPRRWRNMSATRCGKKGSEMSEMGEYGLADAAGSAGRREMLKAANRREILDAGRRTFARIGFETATVRDIIRGTNLAAGTFYNYFKSKEEVFAALQDDSAARFRPRLRAQAARAETLSDLLREALDAYFTFLWEEQSGDSGQAATQAVRADTPEMAAVFNEVRDLIESAIARGLAPPVNARYLAAAAIGVAREIGDRAPLASQEQALDASRFCVALLSGGVSALPATLLRS
jgi:AcrR family transcriptional regulator